MHRKLRPPPALPVLLCCCVACGGDAPGPEDAGGAGDGGGCHDRPLEGNGSHYNGSCYREDNCAWDETCVDTLCGDCTTPAQCRSTQGCLPDGNCGSCSAKAHCEADEDCFSGLCLPPQMRVLELAVDPQQWDEMRIDKRYEQLQIPCSLRVDGVSYPGCTVRPRGQSSLDYKKLPLRITFAEGASHPGYARKINLRSEYNDRSYLRLVLANETFRRLTEIPTPRTRFARLQVNGADYGIYLEYERIGGKFLERHRRDRNSAMYEADPLSTELFQQGIAQLIPLGDQALYPQGYQKKNGAEGVFTDLIALIEDDIAADMADGGSCRVRQRVNLQLYLDYLAVMGLLQGKDHVHKNFYLSWQRDAEGELRWEFYPWDLDLTFGCIYSDEHLTFCDTLVIDEDPLYGRLPAGDQPRYPADAVFNALVETVLRDPMLRAEVERRICQMIGSDFWTREILAQIDGYEQVLLPQLADDGWDRIESIDQFTTAVEEVRRFVRQRTTFLASELGCP